MSVWQKCPVCDGQGLVNKPAGVAGDQATWVDSHSGPYSCRRCAETGTIASPASGALRELSDAECDAVGRNKVVVASFRDWLTATRDAAAPQHVEWRACVRAVARALSGETTHG